MKQLLCTVKYNEEIMPEVYLLSLESPYLATEAQPGQFITIRCNDVMLRRPFSIHKVNSGQVSILFQVLGKGTRWLSKQLVGTQLDILGPLGRAFKIEPQSKNLLLVGGGIGIAPLIFLLQRNLSDHVITLVHGASTASLIYPVSSYLIHSTIEKKEYKKDTGSLINSRLRYFTVTNDGSLGQKGVATDIMLGSLGWADQVFACGPINMYRTMSEYYLNIQIAKTANKSEKLLVENMSKLNRCQISLEMIMGCGVGTCYGCSINTKNGMQKVCQDGPVFELGKIIWDEMLM